MIYTAFVKSDDRGISRGIYQGTRKVNENDRHFFDSSNGLVYAIGGEAKSVKIMHPSNMGGDNTYFVHLLTELEKYNSIEEVLAKFSVELPPKSNIIKSKKKKEA